MTRFYYLFLVALGVLSQWSATTDLACSAPFLPPVQTLNFDFGGGSTYSGDDGVISSPGGTYWNAVSANDLTGFCCGMDMLDEFGQPTKGIVFTGTSPTWINSSSPTNQGPRSDGIQPSSSDNVSLTIGRVREFQELIVYFNSPVGELSPTIDFGGGFGYAFFDDETLAQPFPYASGSGSLFPGSEGDEYLRFTTQPPIGGGLGEAPTLTIILEDPISTIAAIQIRGRFKGLPEPSSLALILIGSSIAMLRRAPTLTNFRQAFVEQLQP